MDQGGDLALIFLGVIALASLVQGLFLAGLAWGGLRAMRRIAEVQKSVREEIRPALDNAARVTHELAEASRLAGEQVRRIRGAAMDSVARVEETRIRVREAVAGPSGSLKDVLALVRGVRRGMDVYRRLGALQAQERGAARRYADDQHLFI
jgi:hypothetical protein